jgi:hypothetical protein
VIPWVDRGCPFRRAAFEFTRRYWDSLGDTGLRFQVVVSGGPEPFSRAAAINHGVRDSTADVILQADPDSLVPIAQALRALERAAETDGLVIAHDRYLYLSEQATGLLYEDTRLASWRLRVPKDYCESFGEFGVGNVVAFSRRTWELAGGYDERFGVWGGDDAAFALACGTLAGEQRRVPGDVLHCWHPRLSESVPGHPEYARSMRLLREYHAAADGGPEAMRALIDSREAAA